MADDAPSAALSSAPSGLTPEQDNLLRALARVVVYIPRAFEADLGRAEAITTSEYFVLMHLSEAAGTRQRMGEIATQTALSPGAVTRVVKLLEGKGLVHRERSAVDGRGQDAVLTDAGAQFLARVRPVHLASVHRRVFAKLAGRDLAAVADALDRIGRDDDH